MIIFSSIVRNGFAICRNNGTLLITFLRVWMSFMLIAWEMGARIRQADTKNAPPWVIARAHAYTLSSYVRIS